ncbi:Terpenoid cyclases Protein prenyltransferase [Rhizoctonia solani]|uniref:Geranylgeranyl transferase type-2 subunit beta n=1 Tax=Rhizoctonia solani TaxID=456999 RepID=A0A8H7M5L1_9AGAM|nr:Terpenoid cyclases Protein prenyltransferase [Rhizoctonia solani]
MGQPTALDRDEMVEFVMSCWNEKEGGFGTFPGHDAHVLSTLSAIQILVMQNATDKLDKPRITDYILSLQSPDGSFAGDRWEKLTRGSVFVLRWPYHFSDHYPNSILRRLLDTYASVGTSMAALALAKAAKAMLLKVNSRFLYVCLGTLAILDKLDEVDQSTLGWWLAERQLPNGGLNGRPEKLEDVCYSFWVLSSLAIIRRLHWIDSEALTKFILSAQDPESGGIADRPGDMADVFHTVFGVAGLSLLGYPGLVDLDPVYCMPAPIIEKLGLRKDWRALPRRS